MAYLIELGSISRGAMMEAVYQALIVDHERILNATTDPERVAEALDQVINWFEEQQKYEYCQKIQHIKRCLKSK